MAGVWRCWIVVVAAIMVMALASGVSAQDCGSQAGGKLCPGGLCCSEWGWCGETPQYCDSNQGCQSQCTSSTPPPPPPSSPAPSTPPPPPSGEGVGSILSEKMFDSMLLHRTDSRCQGSFYTYTAFLSATEIYPDFGNEGSLEIRKREIAAFLAQTSHETTGGGDWPAAPDGPYAWGYCFIEEVNAVNPYCSSSIQWPCAEGKKYYGRGPIQLSWNFNYGPAGVAIGFDGINNPEVVAKDPTISFKTALWFWMTPQSPKPSCHDVMVGKWTPSNDDEGNGRLPGYGMTTNIINGGNECGKGTIIPTEEDRIGFFDRYCSLFGISIGDNLSCEHQTSYPVTSHSPQDEDLIRQVTVS